MEQLLEERCTIVTGGSSGIGRAIARTFAGEGSDVVVADVQDTPREGGRPTHELIRSETDSRARYTECDVTDRSNLETAVEVAEEFGGVDTLVNNAGVLIKQSFFDVTEAEFDLMTDVNVKGAFFAAQCAADRMRDGDGGSIVNLSSVSGFTGSRGQTVYCSTKGAIRLMTYALADELAEHDIQVNALHPGATETMQATDDSKVIATDEDRRQRIQTIPSGRIGSPEDVAKAALFLASDLGGYVNAESLVVDGGMTNTK